MICPNCENEIPDGSKNCPICGAQLGSQKQQTQQQQMQIPIETIPAVESGSSPHKKKKGLTAVLIAAAALLVAGFLVWFFVLRIPAVESLILSESNIQMALGEQKTITYTILPEKAAEKTVTWTSSDEKIATVDRNGLITVHNGGECTITATADKQEQTVHLSVIPDAESITLSESDLQMSVDEQKTITYTIMPEKAAGKTVTWTSSDEKIATVDREGQITVHNAGECIITATVDKQSAHVQVKAVKANATELMIVGKWYGKWASVDDKVVQYNDTIVLNDDLTGTYRIKDTAYDFTWSFWKMGIDNPHLYFFNEEEGLKNYTLMYDEEDNLLVLAFGDDLMLCYHR
jgi:uncharacterized protein YjdB